jgi:hypothetical protein
MSIVGWRCGAEVVEVHIRRVVVGETEPQDGSDADARRDLHERALEDARQDVQPLRAERDAHADLARSPDDGEGRHRIDAGERQHQRQVRYGRSSVGEGGGR